MHPAIVWQDRRTAERCAGLPAGLIRERTGLVPDPYFSATKLEWILARTELPAGELAFGTIDSWLVWKLTGGAAHVTDVTNASRTMLLDLATRRVGRRAARAVRRRPRASSRTSFRRPVSPPRRRCSARASPSQGSRATSRPRCSARAASRRARRRRRTGRGRSCWSTLGDEPGEPAEGLLTTAAAVAPGSHRRFAAEGSVLVGGAALQWLRDGLGLIESAAESERLATSVDSTEGVTFVPALTGLGSPQWRPDARGLISGLTRGTTRAHLVRAALEAVAHQVADVLDALPLEVAVLRADGGATANGFLMQLQADLLGCPVEVAADADATALGAAALAGLGVGTWSGLDEVAALIRRGARYEPRMPREEAGRLRGEWRDALRRVLL